MQPGVGLCLKFVVAMVTIVEVCCCYGHHRLQYSLVTFFLSSLLALGLPFVLFPEKICLFLSSSFTPLLSLEVCQCAGVVWMRGAFSNVLFGVHSIGHSEEFLLLLQGQSFSLPLCSLLSVSTVSVCDLKALPSVRFLLHLNEIGRLVWAEFPSPSCSGITLVPSVGAACR